MSVLLSREDQNIKESTSTQSPLLNPNGHKTKAAPKSKDVLRHVNEKMKFQEKVEQENLDSQDNQDTDSESEKLSPLLDAATMTSAEIIPLHMGRYMNYKTNNSYVHAMKLLTLMTAIQFKVVLLFHMIRFKKYVLVCDNSVYFYKLLVAT